MDQSADNYMYMDLGAVDVSGQTPLPPLPPQGDADAKCNCHKLKRFTCKLRTFKKVLFIIAGELNIHVRISVLGL